VGRRISIRCPRLGLNFDQLPQNDAGDQNADLELNYIFKQSRGLAILNRTVRPALKERFETVLMEERDWPEAELQQYELYELIDGLSPVRRRHWE